MDKLLNWPDFQRKLGKQPLFSWLDVRREFGVSKSAALLTLHRYRKRGLIERLRQNIYTMPSSVLPDTFLANHLYEPSYISLEFALSYHRIIPENVYSITSVTPKATRKFTIRGKVFSYRKIKMSAYTGYHVIRQRGIGFAIAEPEKAFVDLTYYRLRSGSQPLQRIDKEKLNRDKVLRYAKMFDNAKLVAVIITTLR
ncbi:MAG: hypothetical protein COT26_01690 [Candidatus Kerfeldbacteria bacterium CG08_land_8_20_14_0_20_43_14]|uniref:Transcriptional regulator n=1 Tax=Candidatus Kerfeldbacteria bacterium CG08_land_8_20_14_0_20_43_14 TaxID=2014246 RepID=A0A2H0YQG6_9BACT|nr:MAG: hypothetical protein COT26_01690 [Candidatus Kerfeldbacteria bacterium CG08_land_8_20_14_0_20_43_14]